MSVPRAGHGQTHSPWLLFCLNTLTWVMSHKSWVMSHESWVMSHDSRQSHVSNALHRQTHYPYDFCSALSHESWVMSHESWPMSLESWVTHEVWVMGHGSWVMTQSALAGEWRLDEWRLQSGLAHSLQPTFNWGDVFCVCLEWSRIYVLKGIHPMYIWDTRHFQLGRCLLPCEPCAAEWRWN